MGAAAPNRTRLCNIWPTLHAEFTKRRLARLCTQDCLAEQHDGDDRSSHDGRLGGGPRAHTSLDIKPVRLMLYESEPALATRMSVTTWPAR